jgi:hypothetical protein
MTWRGFPYVPGIIASCAQSAGSNVMLYVNEEFTAATGGSTTTLDDTARSWPTNFWVGWTIATDSPFQTATVVSNTATHVVFSPAFSTAVTSGMAYFFSSASGAFTYNIAGTNYTTGSQYNQVLYGTAPQQYSVNIDAFGAPAAILAWSNNYNCWGCYYGNSYGGNGYYVNGIGAGNVWGYPSVSRGYVGGGSGTTSATGYTTSVGMGIELSAMTKAKVHVSIQTYPSTANNGKWDFLMDNYWYTVADPATLGGSFTQNIQVDMQVYPAMLDATGYGFGYQASSHNPSTITISGNTYDCVISSKGTADWGNGFANTTNGYCVSFYLHPTNIAAGGATPPGPQLFGAASSTHDLYAMATWLSGLTSSSRDNNNNMILNASGVQVTPGNNNVPMSTSNYLGRGQHGAGSLLRREQL